MFFSCSVAVFILGLKLSRSTDAIPRSALHQPAFRLHKLFMKHIKKKFSLERVLTEADKERLSLVATEIGKENIKSKIKIPSNKAVLMQTEEGKGILAFQYNRSGTLYIIPEPDPILIYFHNAQSVLKRIQETKDSLFECYKGEKSFTSKIGHSLYHFYGTSSAFVIFLFTAIEAFINHSIPDGFEYSQKSKKNTIVYNKDQIQKEIRFDEKLKKILPEVYGKSFHDQNQTKQSHIDKLRNFRDDIVHTKTVKGDQTQYAEIFKTAFDFNYETTLHTVRDLFNFYRKGYVEECDCGEDF